MTPTELTASRIEEIKKCQTLTEFVPLRVKDIPNHVVLKQFNRTTSHWDTVTFKQLWEKIQAWQHGYTYLGLAKGARVAYLMNNCVDAIVSDQAALQNGLIGVPLHAIDTPGSFAHNIGDSGAACLVTTKKERWDAITKVGMSLRALKVVILTEECDQEEIVENGVTIIGRNVLLKKAQNTALSTVSLKPDDLACIMYTSGTTGKPKGVMLTHRNIITNVVAILIHVKKFPLPTFTFLSFLPLSHAFERTCCYYLSMGMGLTIAFNRSIMQLADDLKTIKPDVFISVPRVYEKIYMRVQSQLKKSPSYVQFLFRCAVNVGWRNFCRKNHMSPPTSFWSFLDPIVGPVLQKLVGDKIAAEFGGNLKLAVTGGAPMNHTVAKLFCALGLAPIQGYGMTEASPVIAGEPLNLIQPDTVGRPLSFVQVRLDPKTKEIQVKGPSVMKGYWNRPDANAKVLSEDGWLSTGDVGAWNQDNMLKIVGRIKEIIVTSTGEKVPPVDLELAIETDPLFSQAFIVGEGRPFISLVTVLNPEEWQKLAATLGVDPSDSTSLQKSTVRAALLRRVKAAAADFPHYALPRAVIPSLEPWTIDNGLLTPTLKLKRAPLMKLFEQPIEAVYKVRN